MLDKVLVLLSPLVDEGGNKYPTDSAVFERSLPGMKGVEKLQLGKEKIWCPERSFLILCLLKEQVLNTTIKCSLVKNSVLRQSTLRSLFLFYNAWAKSILRAKGLSSPNEPFLSKPEGMFVILIFMPLMA